MPAGCKPTGRRSGATRTRREHATAAVPAASATTVISAVPLARLGLGGRKFASPAATGWSIHGRCRHLHRSSIRLVFPEREAVPDSNDPARWHRSSCRRPSFPSATDNCGRNPHTKSTSRRRHSEVPPTAGVSRAHRGCGCGRSARRCARTRAATPLTTRTQGTHIITVRTFDAEPEAPRLSTTVTPAVVPVPAGVPLPQRHPRRRCLGPSDERAPLAAPEAVTI